jgi:hypothetical protein
VFVGRYSAAGGYCSAVIDDVYIYKSALSAERIGSIYLEDRNSWVQKNEGLDYIPSKLTG